MQTYHHVTLLIQLTNSSVYVLVHTIARPISTKRKRRQATLLNATLEWGVGVLLKTLSVDPCVICENLPYYW